LKPGVATAPSGNGLRTKREPRTTTDTLQHLARERARELQKPITRQQPTQAGQRSGKRSKSNNAEPCMNNCCDQHLN